MSNVVTINGKKYKLPRGWHLMTPEWLSRISGIPLEYLVPKKEENSE